MSRTPSLPNTSSPARVISLAPVIKAIFENYLSLKKGKCVGNYFRMKQSYGNTFEHTYGI
jgi:hypothetical protein